MQTQIKGQISFYDILTEKVELGFVESMHYGTLIPFSKLRDYIGKKVVYVNGDRKTGKVVQIMSYIIKSDTYYTKKDDEAKIFYNDYLRSITPPDKRKEFKPALTCDRLGYTDDNRSRKENSWISEAYCYNERFPKVGGFDLVYFYEYA